MTHSTQILLIDDHELVRFGLRQMAQDVAAGAATVVEAGSLQEGLRLYAQMSGASLVILDLNLPDSRGLSGLRSFKQRNPAARVIVLSGSVDDAIAAEALSIGAEAFLHKTHEVAGLRSILHRLLSAGGSAAPEPKHDGAPATSTVTSKRLTLSSRELKVLDLVLQGCTNQEIAEVTGLAAGTVKNYISGLFSVFGVTSRSKLIALFH